MSNPFHRDPHPDLTKAILGVVNESHTRAQLEKLSTTRLRELMKKYERLVLRGDKDASRELADIRGILRSKGAGHALEEASACERAAAARLRAANAEDLEEKGGKAGEAAHKRLHKTIKSVVGEEQEYTAALEAALLALCEELDITTDELFEMAQTAEREAESEKNLRKLSRRAGDWETRLRNQTKGKAARKRQAKADAELQSAEDRHRKEQKSKTVYGKGGKPVRKGSEDHKRAMKRKRDMNAKKRADAERHERQKRESEAWHRSKAGDRDHRAQMHGFSDDLHMRGPRVDHENYR
jgi:hypothetical protein